MMERVEQLSKPSTTCRATRHIVSEHMFANEYGSVLLLSGTFVVRIDNIGSASVPLRQIIGIADHLPL